MYLIRFISFVCHFGSALQLKSDLKLLSLEAFVNEQRNSPSLNHLTKNLEIILPNDQYHSSNYEVTSTTFNLNGNGSTIFPSSIGNTLDLTQNSGRSLSRNGKQELQNQLFVFSNSTTRLSDLTFDCGTSGSSLAAISSSSVRVYESRVISNSERTPFVVVGENGWEETSISLIGCSHTSSCFPSLLPLASLKSRYLSSASPSDVDVAQNVEIASHGLWIRDASLIVGTGPLFDFYGFGSQLERKETCFVKTTLSSSCILNTTSDFMGSVARERKEQDCGSDVGLVSGVSQSLIGSCVSSCTNHLYGTAIHDLNLGGSVLSKNTSFTHTTTTLDYHNEHKTTQTTLNTAIQFHHFSLCTFKGCTGQYQGGAIILNIYPVDLEIESCSFDSCSSGTGGGAVFFSPGNTKAIFVLSSSSFVGCSSAGGGGSLCVTSDTSITISDTIFRNSNSTNHGGAVLLSHWDFTSSGGAISNCLFENCQTTTAVSEGGGGGLYCRNCLSIRLDSFRFRGCSTVSGNGRDMYFYTYNAQTTPLPTVSLSTVSNCDSTSTPEENRIYPANIVSGTVLPTPTQTATILSLTAQLISSTEAEIVVTLNKAVSGKLLVLLSNAEGTPRTDSTKAPNIDRVLAFTLSSNVGKTTVSIDDTGLLQLPLEDYRITIPSLSGHNVSFSNAPIVMFTPSPTLLSANCVLDESFMIAVLNLEGSCMDGESFVFTLHDESTFEATFASSEARVTLELTGEGAEWKENMMFVIVSGKKKNSDSISVSIPTPVYFTIPERSRLTNIEVSELNEDKTGVTLLFTSRQLKGNEELEVTIQKASGDDSEVMKLRTNAEGQIISQTVTLYPSNKNAEEWKNWIVFGESYKVVGVLWKRSEGDVAVQFSSIVFGMPVEVVRVSSADCSKDSATSTIVSIVGVGFVVDETYTLTLSGTPTSDSTSSDIHAPTITVKASSRTTAQSSALSLSWSSEESLRFGFTYAITAITNGTEDGVVEGGEFKTPSEPSVTSISRKLKDGDAKTVEISISGLNIPDGEYWLVLKGKVSTKETELKIRIANSEGKSEGTVEFGIFSSSEMEYGAEYEVTGLFNSLVTVALPKAADRSLTMPEAPARVMSVSCELSGEKKTHAKIVISGTKLPSGKTLSVKVKEVDPTGSLIGYEIALSEIEIAKETSTKSIEMEVYEANKPSLEYGKTYELISLAISDTASCILDESVRFSVPIEPVRIKSVLCPETNPNWTVVTLGGSGFVSGEFYTVTVSGHPIDSASPPPSTLHEASFVVTASSDQLAKSSALQLYPAEGSDLKFSYSYTIEKITNGTEDGVIHSGVFNTQADVNQDEALITRFEVVLASSLNTSMMIEVSGSHLPSGTIGTMTLNESFTFNMSFSSDTFGRSEVIPLGVSDSLAFGSEYTITSLENSNKQPIQTTQTTITTPPKPSKLSFYVCGTEASAGVDQSGADPESCFGIKSAWNSATSLGILDTTMRIVNSADLSSPLIVTTSVPFTLLSFQAEPATLQARPSASQPNCVLISVKQEAECRLTLLTVIADLSGSSFKLVSASKGTVVIRSCSIEGRGGSGSSNEDVSICGWSRGFLELIETDTELNSVTLKEIEMGGIWMSGGKLNVTAGVFSHNGPSNADFPSTRQNIHCEGEGMLVIDSLAKGDGTEDTPSAWIDSHECTVDAKQSIKTSPLFVPTLLPNSSSSFNSSSKQYRIVVVGSSLFPCGLSLEVSSQKGDKRESVEFALSGSSDGVSSFSESEIVVTLASSSFSSLHTSEEWKGCLLFGNNQSSSSFVIRSPSSSDQKQAEGGVTSRGWIVGLVVGIGILALIVILLLVVLGVRSRALKKDRTPSQSEMDETDHFEMKLDDVNELNRHSGDTSFYGMGSKSIVVESSASDFTQLAHSEGKQKEGDDLLDMVEVMNGLNPVSVIQLTRNCSLYNRLHGTNQVGFSKRQVGLELARGVEQIAKTDSSAPILTTLSPHWIFLDSKDKVFFQTKAALTQGAFFGSGLGESTEKARNRERVEDQRWQAPEMVKGGVVAEMEKAAVFSLGILLWELETGEIPCKEVDAVNAQRAFESGFQLSMTTITNKTLAELIDKCVTPDVDSRPLLKHMVQTLEGLEEKKQPEEMKLFAESTSKPSPAI